MPMRLLSRWRLLDQDIAKEQGFAGFDSEVLAGPWLPERIAFGRELADMICAGDQGREHD